MAQNGPNAENQAQMLPEPVEPRQEQVNPEKNTYFDLNANERKVFDQAFRHYQLALKRYEDQEKGLQEAKDSIKARVSSAKSRLLKGEKDAKEWLKTLKQACSVSKGYILQQASERYLAAVRKQPTPGTPQLAGSMGAPETKHRKWLCDLAHH